MGLSIHTTVDIAAMTLSLAHSSDDYQAAFLNGLGEDLKTACDRKDAGAFGRQCCDIANKLDHSGRAIIAELAAFTKTDQGGD